MTPSQVANFQKEAQLLEKMELYKAITVTLTEDAQRRMFVTSQNVDDIFAGKMLLYALNIIEKVIHTAANPHIDKPIIKSNNKNT